MVQRGGAEPHRERDGVREVEAAAGVEHEGVEREVVSLVGPEMKAHAGFTEDGPLAVQPEVPRCAGHE